MPLIYPISSRQSAEEALRHYGCDAELVSDGICWRHDYRCRHYYEDYHAEPAQHPDCHPNCGWGERLYLRAYPGAVIYTFEHNSHEDSDFMAVVWSFERQRVEVRTYASTRYYSYDHQAVVDATPEVKELARAWAEARLLEKLRKEAISQASELRPGCQARVVRGRDVGKAGRVFWMRKERHYTRVGLALSEERGPDGRFRDVIWTYAANLEVIPQVNLDEQELRQKAQAMAVQALTWGLHLLAEES